jgi:glutamine synthetase|tara:strand:- start:4596 stop:4736 length:141 start_codon:yes stop_codon:yes gene_type:complete
MTESAVLRTALGETVLEHYAHFFCTEHRKYDAAVTNWERERCFERV